MSDSVPFGYLTFFENIFEDQGRSESWSDSLEALLCNEYVDTCRAFDATQIQDSWSWRNTYTARELSKRLISESGEFKKEILVQAISILEKKRYSLGPGRQADAGRVDHILKILKLLHTDTGLLLALKRIGRPLGHPVVERIIRETLFLSEGALIKDYHAKAAALSALLTSLRQNVGSCFATAPAILIQQEQPLLFLKDVNELFGAGSLSRTFEGLQYAVPLSTSWGVGDLYRPFSLSLLGNDPLKTLAASPGLQAAFDACGLIEKKEWGLREKKCETLLKGAIALSDESFMIVTPEQILKTVLLKAYDIDEKDVAAYMERSLHGPMAEIMIQAPPTLSGKSLACSRYISALEKGKLAFKALTDNALLKSWEFTLASLSESKADFARWNLYSSLGVQPDEPHGIGQSLYEVIQEKINRINDELNEFQSRYDHLFAQAKYLEGRITRATTEREAGWIQAEYHIRREEIHRALSERDALYDKGQRLQGIYSFLIDFYGKKIKEYFQEVYDAEMHDIVTNAYDDSPAGFRLLYKHGRSHTALWTVVNSAAEYIQHLISFFVSTEIELNQKKEIEGLQKEISELITAEIMTVKRKEFLESSIYRLARAYKEPIINNPLEHLDAVKRKPWVYISGGSMSTLVSCYWGNPEKPQEEKRWVESENELLAFFIDTLKTAPAKVQQKFQKNPDSSMLAFSPTHAYLCKPGWSLFKEAWESDVYTYTWIRDYWVAPQKKFLDTSLLNNRMMDLIVQKLLLFIPHGYRPIVKSLARDFSYSMTPPEFREHLINSLSYEKWLQVGGKLDLIGEEIDSLLYATLPLFPDHALREKLEILFQEIEGIDSGLKNRLIQIYEKEKENFGRYAILTAQDLRNIAKGLLILAMGGTRTSLDLHLLITKAMQKTGLSYPEPFLFGDTNWVKNVFGFVLNPGKRGVELWRLDPSGSEGRPISIWKKYLNGQEKGEWGLYINPREYGNY